MMSKPIFIGALSALLSFSVLAENSEVIRTNAVKSLSPLLVTAGLTPIAADHYGGTVTLIERDEIQASQALYLGDLLRSVPGFSISQSGGLGSQTQVRIRGAEANHVLVLRDGVRVNDVTGSDEFLFNYALLDDVERIEIIRGPQSAIWGTDAMAAVINIITRKATDYTVQTDMEYGSFNSKKLGVSAGTQQTGWRFNGGVTAIDSGGTNISLVGDEKDGYENLSAHLNLDNDWNDVVSSSIRFHHTDAMNEYDGTDFVDTGLPVDADLWTERTQTTAMAQLQINPLDSPWSSRWSYQFNETEATNYSHLYGQDSATESQSHELNALNTWTFGTDAQHRLNVLLDHREIDFKQAGMATDFGDPNHSQEYDVTGIAAEFQGVLGERINWQVSTRHDRFSDFDNVSNYQLATVYQLTATQRLRATVGTGSKAPTFIERFGYFPAQFIGNPNLRPEESTGFELAYQWQHNQHHWNMVYFNHDLKNEIDGFVFNPLKGAFTAENKINDSDREGLEFSWSAQWSKSFSSHFNYTYTDATEEDAQGLQQVEVRRPKNSLNLTLDYAFADNRGRLYTTIHHQSSQLDNFYSPTTYETEKVQLAGFTTVNLNLSWSFNDRSRVYLRSDNLLDEKYQEVYGYARPGVGYYAGYSYRF